jgi:hypothetical protein
MINEKYLEITNPLNIKSFFKTDNEFISWLETGSIEDLKHTLKAFENEELYEDCIIINRVLMHGTQKNATSNAYLN